ncbi:M15 family metallopeptidase [Paenibacillus prosopidis]|uniref:D-alanyl-D-alanine carboxypeptidase n=1 Tax=Paenibacillus prosopidis TaxID=630520 RepID=A0A368VUN5_9BACL|nr:M15 family metallopeptidase [Paenibacillus prosopidis]RCW44941.1 D-alanyl-D-alanine carboxypeptidase [Paenibacillus prosopidis]
MKKRKRFLFFIIVCASMVIVYSFIKTGDSTTIPPKQSAVEEGTVESGGEVQDVLENADNVETPAAGDGQAGQTEDGLAVIAQPESITVMVNKQNKLPEDYNPSDLVYPDVRFIFDEKVEKRMLRKEAAGAIEEMFTAAENDSIALAGVSAYRSHTTQKSLFERYVKRDGLVKARTYSAFPGTSEHETGLAIDISGSDGKCAAADCFAGTKEALWLEEHAHEFGFIIRYLKGKEAITGYQYEPWHLRYVGTELAAELKESGETLEEYYDAVPVSK